MHAGRERQSYHVHRLLDGARNTAAQSLHLCRALRSSTAMGPRDASAAAGVADTACHGLGLCEASRMHLGA